MTTKTATDVPLAARALCAGHGEIPVLRDVDLEVYPGTVTSLLGRNGAGKSTTLLTLAGALPVMSGQVEWLGRPVVASLPALARQGLAYIPEGRSVFGELTVADNLRLGQGPPARAVELFPELEKHLRRRAGNLSGGQQQMLALARALASDPIVLLADELSLGLAPLVVDRVLAAVRAAADRGVAVLLVEQHVRLALSIADRGYVLDRGRVVLDGAGDALRSDLVEIERMYLEGESADDARSRLNHGDAEEL